VGNLGVVDVVVGLFAFQICENNNSSTTLEDDDCFFGQIVFVDDAIMSSL
jgi:hypothetical protein